MIIVSSGIIYFSIKNSIPFSIGPNEQLYILQIPINTNTKYMIIVTFCFCNSIFRSLHHNFLQPWILHEIQDTDMEKERMVSISICYEISCVSTIYVWFDFFMYMHILLSQIDFFLVEIIADILTTVVITKYYLDKHKPSHPFVYSEISI